MFDVKMNKASVLRNKSILISVFIVLIFLILPWIFTETASFNFDTQILEEVGLVKSAADLLSPQIWWYLLPLSVFFLCLTFYFTTRAPSNKPTSPIKGLTLQGFVTLEVYFFFFLLPFPLQRYYNLTRVSMGWIADRSWVAAITLSFALVTLFLLYISAYRLTLRQNKRQLWIIVFVGAFLFALINLFIFPISSTDLYDYVSRGRISGIYGDNPLVRIPNDYPFDPIVQLAAWRRDPSAYGPLWEVISGLIGRFVGAQLWKNMLGYKILAFISYILSTFTIAAILKKLAPHRSLSGTLLFAWNPLILLDGVANAHNDMVMVAFILGAFWILNQTTKHSLSNKNTEFHPGLLTYGCLALLFLILGILIKFIPILLLPLFLFYLLSYKEPLRRKLLNLILPLLLSSFVFFLYYRIFWAWPEITNSMLNRTEMFRTSLASLTNLILGEFLQPAWAHGIAAYFFLAAFGLAYLVILFRTAGDLGILSSTASKLQHPYSRWRKLLNVILRMKTEDRNREPLEILISSSLHIFLLYLLLGSLWFWPWYMTWPLALLALNKDQLLIALLVVASCAGQLTFILWNFLWYWIGIEWSTLYIVETLALCLIIVPVLIIYIIYKRKGGLIKL